MAVSITMEDSLITRVVDEDIESVLFSLNAAAGSGKMFVGMDDTHGRKVLFNLPNIMTIDELDD